MHCDELLFTTTCQSSTGRPFFLHNRNDRMWPPNQSQIQTTSLASRMFEIANVTAKKLHTFECKYLNFHTVYGPGTWKSWANLKYGQKFWLQDL